MSKATTMMPAPHGVHYEIKMSPTSAMLIGGGVSMMIWGAIIVAIFA
jgi:hypothetical protein